MLLLVILLRLLRVIVCYRPCTVALELVTPLDSGSVERGILYTKSDPGLSQSLSLSACL